jgi:hypothetical protein
MPTVTFWVLLGLCFASVQAQEQDFDSEKDARINNTLTGLLEENDLSPE